MWMFKEFHEIGKFVKTLNNTFIVVVLTKGSVEDFKNFGPISLVGSLYKILAKILSNRLKGF